MKKKTQTKSKAKSTRWDHTKSHHAQVWLAMQKVLQFETYAKPYSDDRLCELIRASGIYTTPTITRDVRIANNVPTGEQRRVLIFARQHKGE